MASFLFIPAANPSGAPFPVLILGWTLNFEMLFYACFAIGLLFRRSIGVTVIATILLALAISGLFGPFPLPFQIWCSSLVTEFLFGMGIAALRRRGTRVSTVTSILLIATAVALLVVLRAMDIPGVDYRWRFLWAGVPSLLICAGVALVREPENPGAFKRFFIFGGDMSFALYLSHPFTLTALAFAMTQTGVRDPSLYIGVSFFICMAVAAGIYLWIERPVYRWLSAQYEQRRYRRTVAGA